VEHKNFLFDLKSSADFLFGEVAMKLSSFLLAATVISFALAIGTPASADPGDTTWVRTFDHDFYNWATPHVDTFALPDTTKNYSKILLYYTIGCPSAPADCDPWDRLGYLQVLHDTGEVDTLGQPILEPFEIARVITPYDITGSGRPDSCAWEFDVTPYRTFLHDTVMFSNYIESWMGDDRGWLVTIDFAFIEGETQYEAYKVVNLWQDYHVVYGNPDDPIEEVLDPRMVDIDEGIVGAGVRVITTGHGQGNTDNCAEFCNKEHTIIVNDDSYIQYLWRDDCSQNPCSPQGGNWQFGRAGWCPGSAVFPWDINITSSIVPGEPAVMDYNVELYENFCRPSNPDCVNGITCPDCEYNYTGHTQPHFSIQAQLIFYREKETVGVVDGDAGMGPETVPKTFALYQNFPNPFNPTTTISFDLPGSLGREWNVSLCIYDLRGKLVKKLLDSNLLPGYHRVVWDGKNDRGEPVTSGVYISALKTDQKSEARKIVLLK
jgi:hypothetical protein